MRTTDRKKLWALAGGRCSRCRVHHSEALLEEAHIVAPDTGGPRGGDPLPADRREDYDNYLLLCPNCHTTIDARWREWPVERLRRLKAEHEEWVRSAVAAINILAGIVNVRAPGADDVAGARIRRPTRIAAGTRLNVDAPGARRVTGVEIGGPDG